MSTEIPHGISGPACSSCLGLGAIYELADGRWMCEGCIAVLSLQFHASVDDEVNGELRATVDRDARIIAADRWMKVTRRQLADTSQIKRLIDDGLRQLGAP